MPGGMVARGTGGPARMERTEATGHALQPRSSMSRLTSSVESSAAAARGGPLMLTVERRGRKRWSELSASTMTGCAR